MFFRYFKSYVCIIIWGPQVSRFLNLCAFHHIRLWDINVEESGYSMKIGVRDFFRIKDILKKTESKCKLVRKQGPGFWLKKQAKRKLFLVGPFLCLFLLWFLSGFLWSIDIVGNHGLTDDILGDFLKKQGVYYGMPLNKIPLVEIKTNLRAEFEQINWVSVSVEGTRLEIRLKENDVWEKTDEGSTQMNLISPVKGTVTDILVRRGVALVKAGDRVNSGDVLIEGKIPIMNEDGTLKKIEYCQGDGDVWIRYEIGIEEEISRDYEKKEYSNQNKQKYYLELFGKKLGIDIRKIPYETYDVIEERKNLMLFGSVPLPITVCTRTYREFAVKQEKYTQEEAEAILYSLFEKNLNSLEEKGVQIIEKNVKIVSDDVSIRLQGSISVLRMHNQENASKAE